MGMGGMVCQKLYPHISNTRRKTGRNDCQAADYTMTNTLINKIMLSKCLTILLPVFFYHCKNLKLLLAVAVPKRGQFSFDNNQACLIQNDLIFKTSANCYSLQNFSYSKRNEHCCVGRHMGDEADDATFKGKTPPLSRPRRLRRRAKRDVRHQSLVYRQLITLLSYI